MRNLATLTLLAVAYYSLAETSFAEPVTIGEPTRGYTYFNRPGSDLAAHNAELVECLSIAALVTSEDERAIEQSPGLVSGILVPLIVGEMTRGTRPAAIENCMVVRGWRVVRLPDAEGEPLSVLNPDSLTEQLQAWIGSDEPRGDIVRFWNNDAARASTDRYELRPGATNRGSLSVSMLGDQRIVPIDRTLTPSITVDQLPRSVSARALSNLRPGAAAVIVFLKNASPRNGVGISFERVSPAGGDNTLLAWSHGFSRRNGDGVWRAFIVPPGRWRMSGLHALSLCLGSPGFEVDGGEIVYAGTFDLGAETLGPDLDLTAVRSWLSVEPSLVSRVRAARYTNGWTGTCGGSSIYALEVPGASFREGYTWGSARALAEAE